MPLPIDRFRSSSRWAGSGPCAPWGWCALLLLLATMTAARLPAQDTVLVLSPGPVLTTTAGLGHSGYGGDGGSAAGAALASPGALAYDASGNLYISDTRNHRIRRVDTTGVVTTVAGTGRQGFSGDGGTAMMADLDSPLGVTLAADGTIYLADTRNHRVRRVTVNGTISTIAGDGQAGFGGDTGAATAAQLRSPGAVALGMLGELYIADTGNHRVRRVALDGMISTVAGNGSEESTGDGALATNAGLDAPSGLAIRHADGALLIADRLNSRIRVVTSDGKIDSLSQSAVRIRRAAGLSVDASDRVYIADTGNYRLRAVTANGSGLMLGSGEQGRIDPASAYNATPLGTPVSVVGDAAGGVSFSDRDRHQVQHLALPQVNFYDTAAGQRSAAKNIILRNGGGAPLQVFAIVVPPSFAVSNGTDCGSAPFTLAIAAQCTLALAFAPSAAGPQSGFLVVTTRGASQRAVLSGNAIQAGSTLASSTLLHSNGSLRYVGMPVIFVAQVLASGSVRPTGMVHLLNAANEIASAALDGTGTVSMTIASLTTGQHAISARYEGDAHYASSVSASLQETVTAAPDFTVTAASSQLTTVGGTMGSMDVVVQPINGVLNQTLTLAYDGLPKGTVIASSAPTPLVLGSNAVTVTLSVTPPVGALLRRLAGWCGLPLVGVFLFRTGRCRSLRIQRLSIAVTLSLVALAADGCSGGFLNGASTAAQSATHAYPVSVTATATGVTGSPLIHTASFTLVVQ